LYRDQTHVYGHADHSELLPLLHGQAQNVIQTSLQLLTIRTLHVADLSLAQAITKAVQNPGVGIMVAFPSTMVAAIALGTPIARGGFGLVTKVAINGIELAAKSPRVVHGHVSNSLTEIFLSEEQALKDVHHPHVAQLLGSIYGKVTGVVEKVLHLIFPLYACDLSAVKAGVKQLSFMEFVQVAIHLAEGFSHMHDRGYVHLDIKPTNLLLTLPPTKGIVGDLGLARHVDSLGHARFAHAPCGTPPYIAPELGSKENQKIPAYSPASDV